MYAWCHLLQNEILCDPQVKLMHPGSPCSICFSIFTLMLAQITILFHKSEESIFVSSAFKRYVTLFLGYVYQICTIAIAIHIIGIGKAISAG